MRLLGLNFANRVGLAAGYDRDGSRLDEAPAWGFGFVELGTVTPAPVAGHNAGAVALAQRLRGRERGTMLVGVNIGAQPGRAPAEAWRDYLQVMRCVSAHADYLALNLTGETASALLASGHRADLRRLLHAVHMARTAHTPPILLKLPLLAALRADAEIVGEAATLGFDGIIAVRGDDLGSQQFITLAAALPASMTLIAVGGIADPAAARRCASADLIQIHRAFASAGPGLVRALATHFDSDRRACSAGARVHH